MKMTVGRAFSGGRHYTTVKAVRRTPIPSPFPTECDRRCRKLFVAPFAFNNQLAATGTGFFSIAFGKRNDGVGCARPCRSSRLSARVAFFAPDKPCFAETQCLRAVLHCCRSEKIVF